MSSNRLHHFLARYLCPDLYVPSVAKIGLETLLEKGYTTILFDLDNTLLSWRGSHVSEEVLAWLQKAKELGFKMQLVSNSFRKRVKHFSELLRIPAVSKTIKPRKSVFLEALRITNSKPSETIVVGDQLFTDILGGKRLGLFTILVSPVDKRELFTTELVRIPERIFLNLFRKNGYL